MPIKYNQERFGPTEKEFKNRNNTVRKVFNAKGLPRNMGNKEILSRVKVYDNVRTLKGMRNSRYGNDLKMKISNFISNGRVFNQRKRKALVELMLRFDGPHILEILALKNEDVIRYIKYTADFFGDSGVEFRGGRIPHYIANLTYKRRGPHPDYYKRRRGPIREDPGAVRVLKKRTAFLKEMLKVQVGTGTPARDGYGDIGGVMRFRLPRNIRNKISVPSHTNYIHPRHIWRFMQKEFPLPPHPKNAATKIQSVVRGMRNRKKLTTMRKAATTIQKTVQGMRARTTVKKMKTVAGRVSLRGKRKRSPQ
jgi:hypothetical protein